LVGEKILVGPPFKLKMAFYLVVMSEFFLKVISALFSRCSLFQFSLPKLYGISKFPPDVRFSPKKFFFGLSL